MGYRLSKIYTRTGDDGSTGLADGTRVGKDDLRIEVMGDLDELNAALGAFRVELPTDHRLQAMLEQLQHQLLNAGGEIAMPGMQLIKPNLDQELEQDIDRMNEQLEPLKEFILPGGTRAAAACHLARAIARRSERHLIALHHQIPQPAALIRFLNRLSDWLFVLARTLVHAEGQTEILWEHDRRA